MDTISKNIKRKAIVLSIVLIALSFALYVNKYKETYNSLNVNVSKLAANVSYGSNIKIADLITKSSGKIVKIGEIDTKKIGEQTIPVILEEDNVVKEIPVKVKVVDKEAPIILINEEETYADFGDEYDLNVNISSVTDSIDGVLPFNANPKEHDRGYYTLIGIYDFYTSGTYKITVKAVDKNNNQSFKDFNLIVREEYKPVTYYNTFNYTNELNVNSSSISATALSLVGYRYVSGGNNPAIGFDCSGLVQYVYGVHGYSIGRDSSSQSYNGQAVDPNAMQPGDIIIWYRYGRPAHSSIYIGGDQMVHAANHGTGVIVSSISNWKTYNTYRDVIGTVRRIV